MPEYQWENLPTPLEAKDRLHCPYCQSLNEQAEGEMKPTGPYDVTCTVCGKVFCGEKFVAVTYVTHRQVPEKQRKP